MREERDHERRGERVTGHPPPPDVPIVTDSAKIVMILHILLTVGTLSSILYEIGRLATQRAKQINRLRLMMRKMDPNLLLELEKTYFDYYLANRAQKQQLKAVCVSRLHSPGSHHRTPAIPPPSPRPSLA